MDFKIHLKSLYEKYGVNYKEGDIVFFEGDHGKDFYIIYCGAVKVVKFFKGNMRVLRILKEGSMFGELSLFSNNTRTATVIAEKDTGLIKINNRYLRDIIDSNADFAWRYLTILAERQEYTYELLRILKQESIEKRVARYLLFMISHKNQQVSLYDLPHLIEIPPDKALDVVKKWEKLNLITIQEEKILSVNKVMLNAYVK